MKTFKKWILLALVAVFATGVAQAVPAYPGKMRVRQADGSFLTIQKLGDERGHMTVSEDGYPLLAGADGCYEYARVENGRLVASGIRATDMSQRPAEARAFLQTVDRDEAVETLRADVRRAPKVNRVRISDIPTTGHHKVLVVLVQFSDKKFQMDDPQQFYTDLLNERGYTNATIGATGSAYDFYSKSSFGAYDPEFVVAGPVTMPHGYSYYGGNTGGYGGGSDNYYRVAEMISSACDSIDGGIDFSEYDSDGDGYVDNVYVFYAGRGEADSYDANTIWPHSAHLSEIGLQYSITLDGVKVDRYATSQEVNGQTGQTVGIGTFVHEFGHVLGLADHYNTVNSSARGQLNSWDTMASGSYSNNQNTPPLFSAFERAELGWLDYTTLNPKTDSVVRLDYLGEYNQAYRINVPGKDNEYFILENRQKTGFDAYLPGHGMLVWHVEMDTASWLANTPNNDPDHQRLDIVEADGTANCDAGDPFPGSQHVTEFSFIDWDGDELFSFASVDEVDSVIRFLLGGTDFDLAAPESVSVSNLLGQSMTISWPEVRGAQYYNVSVVSAADSMAYNNLANNRLSLSNLKPETPYTIRVWAGLAKYLSDPYDTVIVTLPLQFVEKKVIAREATAVGETSFTANWDAIDGTDNYLLSVYKQQLSGRASSNYDFSQMASGFPEGWTTNVKRYSNGTYGKSMPALRMSKDEDWLNIDLGDRQLVGLTFWYQSHADSNTVVVETADAAGNYTPIVSVVTDKEAHTMNVELPRVNNVRIRLERKSSYVCVDDVDASYLVIESVPVDTLTDVSTGTETSYVLQGLDPGATYSYTVIAMQGEQMSLQSDEVQVPLAVVDGIQAITPAVRHDGRREVYDLQGRRVDSRSRLPHGLYIVRENGVTRKVRM